MKKHTKWIVTTTLVLTAFSIPLLVSSFTSTPAIAETITPAITPAKPTLNHAQLVYTYALEWCESRGVETAINPKDLDNTPSYYSWQFKPSTFKYFAILYGVLPKTVTDAESLVALKNYDTERKVIEAMVLHRNDINWSQQFPWCTKKLGLPPLSTPKPKAL